MQTLNKQAAAILAQLINNLRNPGDARTIGGSRGTGIMPVRVECIGADLFSIAHYYEQQGDLMADPEMVFWRCTRGDIVAFYPVHFQQDNIGLFRQCLWFDDGAAVPSKVALREQADQASFANTWMRNIRAQQASWFDEQHNGTSRTPLLVLLLLLAIATPAFAQNPVPPLTKVGSFAVGRTIDPITQVDRSQIITMQGRASLGWRCNTAKLEVLFVWGRYLMGHRGPVSLIQVQHRFPAFQMQEGYWVLASSHRAAFVPTNQTAQFTAAAESLSVRVVDRDGEQITATFSLTGLSEALTYLPCAGADDTPAAAPRRARADGVHGRGRAVPADAPAAAGLALPLALQPLASGSTPADRAVAAGPAVLRTGAAVSVRWRVEVPRASLVDAAVSHAAGLSRRRLPPAAVMPGGVSWMRMTRAERPKAGPVLPALRIRSALMKAS